MDICPSALEPSIFDRIIWTAAAPVHENSLQKGSVTPAATSQTCFHRRQNEVVMIFETAVMRGHACRRLAGLAYLCACADRTSPRAGHRAGPPRVSSRQAGTVEEEPTKRSASRREKGREARRALGFPPFNATILGLLHIIYCPHRGDYDMMLHGKNTRYYTVNTSIIQIRWRCE